MIKDYREQHQGNDIRVMLKDYWEQHQGNDIRGYDKGLLGTTSRK